jgi:hypothetical protein
VKSNVPISCKIKERKNSLFPISLFGCWPMIFCGDGFSNPLKPTWGDVKYFKKSHFLINGNHVKVLVNIISMVALVTIMNIQASKYMVLGWKHTIVTPFGVSHCTVLQGCACLNVSYFKFWNIFTIFLLIILEYNLGKILEKKLFHFTL